MEAGLEGIDASDVSFLPIVSAYARELGVVEEINRLCGRTKGVDAGQVCLALILDTLTGRSPLFRLEDSFAHLDVELLLGEGISVVQLNDDAVGRVLDRLYDVGTNKILSAVALRAVKLFDLDVSHVHQDTTSRSVYGDYELREDGDSLPPFLITHGFSKDKRPDLKQLIHSLLCVDDGIPISTKCEDGNASDKVIDKNLLRLIGEICEVPVYAKGRPKADGSRKIVGKTYRFLLDVESREKDLERAHEEAGCFVLITNEPFESEGGMGSLELLRLYKDQHSIEQNFGFLKDPLIVNALFLKSPKRIEALGLILVLALMVWRLMERTMRMSLRESGSKVTGWDEKPTSRPTSFMMTTKFLSIIVLRLGGRRRLGNPLRTVQADYLRILGLSPDVFVNPEARMCRGVVSRPL